MLDLHLNGVTYHVEGTGQGRPLLLLHGFTGSSQNWAEHAPALAQHHRVIAPDILGHGRSAAPPDPARYAMPRVAADLIALLDTLDIPQATLLGYSMGGRLALYTAVHYPHRFTHLILESASPGLTTAAARDERRQRDETLADWIETHSIERFVNRWEALPLWNSQQQLPPERRATLRRQRLNNKPTGLANSLRGMGTGVQPSLWPRLADLASPTLLIAGALDGKFVPINQKMMAQLSDARLEIVPGAGHTVHLERPSRFRQIVTKFLPQM